MCNEVWVVVVGWHASAVFTWRDLVLLFALWCLWCGVTALAVPVGGALGWAQAAQDFWHTLQASLEWSFGGGSA